MLLAYFPLTLDLSLHSLFCSCSFFEILRVFIFMSSVVSLPYVISYCNLLNILSASTLGNGNNIITTAQNNIKHGSSCKLLFDENLVKSVCVTCLHLIVSLRVKTPLPFFSQPFLFKPPLFWNISNSCPAKKKN